MIRKRINLTSALISAFLIFGGCSQVTHPTKSSVTPPVSFTYTTDTGAVWQVDLNGQKTQLRPDDQIEKWYPSWSPDRQWLAYITREWPETEAGEIPSVQAKLIIVDAKTNHPRQLAGPARGIHFEWTDNSTIELRLTDRISDGGELQQWDVFSLNIETGKMTEIEQEEWDPTPPEVVSPDGRWNYLVEQQGNKRYIYLTDHGGNKVHKVYEKPADQAWPLEWSPDSHYVLYYSTLENKDVYLYRVVAE